MSIQHSRALVSAALNGQLEGVEFVTEPAFGLHIPLSCPGVPAEVLNPRNAWADKAAYDLQAAELGARFEANFRQFDAPDAVRAAGPRRSANE
jgi:phosphoenolpyruvate carboxykinase (ATP)